MLFTIVAAVDCQFGLSKCNELPWRHTDAGKRDMKHFASLTTGRNSVVIMGRKTWESIGSKPLKNRTNIVITSGTSGITTTGVLTASPVVFIDGFDRAISWVNNSTNSGLYNYKKCFVIGGEMVYRQALMHPFAGNAIITRIPGNYECDVFFPRDLLPHKSELRTFDWGEIEYYSFENTDERRYLKLVSKTLECELRPNRTGVATHSKFGQMLKFQLYDQRGRILPLLTSKRVHWPAVYHELIWFLRGSSNTKYLTDNGIKIWDGNSSADFHKSINKPDYTPGEVGPIYGWQWRRWDDAWHPQKHGYKDSSQFHDSYGVDQIQNVIDELITNKWSRRLVVSAWNVDQLCAMVLPPCHYAFQFLVTNKRAEPRLNCIVNMRSADLPLGVPFNIASYAFLTHIISHIVGIKPGKLAISIADCHIYENHEDACRQLVSREPRRFPVLEFGPEISNKPNVTIDDFANDFKINDYIISSYMPHPRIPMDMVV